MARSYNSNVCTALLVSASVLWLASWPAARAADSAVQKSKVPAGAAAFEAIVPALHSPRCMNCHSVGDYPRQGDDSHRHTMDVRRGAHGDGVDPVKCSTCHQDHNSALLHSPPGAPDWELPPASMPMIWEGLTDRQLCELLKDPKRNGHKTVQQIVDHMHTPLVLWGWDPGPGRTAVPIAKTEFLSKVSEWAASGSGCPTK